MGKTAITHISRAATIFQKGKSIQITGNRPEKTSQLPGKCLEKSGRPSKFWNVTVRVTQVSQLASCSPKDGGTRSTPFDRRKLSRPFKSRTRVWNFTALWNESCSRNDVYSTYGRFLGPLICRGS